MKRFPGAVLVALFVFSVVPAGPAGADDKDPGAILDKAIQALGGQEKLTKAARASWKTKGTITFNDNDNEIQTHTTVDGLDHYRSEFEGEFNGNPAKGTTVLSGNKGWRKFGDNGGELDEDQLGNTKRTAYLQIIPVTLVALKGKDFKLEAAGEDKVGDKPAAGIKITGSDGKDFTLYFDKESGLPVKLTARVVGFQGGEFNLETTYGNYKEFDGIKKATKIESKRDGEKFQNLEVTEFKVLETVDPKTFTEPE
jgi:hypothetical protein